MWNNCMGLESVTFCVRQYSTTLKLRWFGLVLYIGIKAFTAQYNKTTTTLLAPALKPCLICTRILANHINSFH